MRTILENIKTIVAEIIGIVGGFLWAQKTHWDYEPLILLSVSSIGFIISISLLISKKKEPEPVPVQKQNLSEGANEAKNPSVTNIEPLTIKRQIKNAPPFQQHDVANHYIGINIQWTLKLFMIHRGQGNKIGVTLEPLNEEYFKVYFEIDIDEYPVFKIAENGKVFTVSGEIKKCSMFDVELKVTALKEN